MTEDASAELTFLSVSIFWYIKLVSELTVAPFVTRNQPHRDPTYSSHKIHAVCVYQVLIC